LITKEVNSGEPSSSIWSGRASRYADKISREELLPDADLNLLAAPYDTSAFTEFRAVKELQREKHVAIIGQDCTSRR
jgi:hypothetical protein